MKIPTQKVGTVFESYMSDAAKLTSIGDLWMIPSYRPDRLLAYIREQQPSAVIATFAPAVECIVYLRDHGELTQLPVGHVLTDYLDWLAVFLDKPAGVGEVEVRGAS